MRWRVADVIAWAFVLGIVYMLVRPGSKAGTALVDVTNALAAVIGTATGSVQRG